jgi:hypothetical protein
MRWHCRRIDVMIADDGGDGGDGGDDDDDDHDDEYRP